MNNTKLVIHLISDSTGETLRSVGAAAAAQFENLDYEENVYPLISCLLYTSPSPRDRQKSRMPSSA